jgi:aspartate/methionine/tyrosine aminotransferase
VQHASAAAFDDDESVVLQRLVYSERLSYLAAVLTEAGIPATTPGGGFYLWVRVPDRLSGDGTVSPAFSMARWLAEHAGVLVSPGDAYGPTGRSHVRFALVQPNERLELIAERLVSSRAAGP